MRLKCKIELERHASSSQHTHVQRNPNCGDKNAPHMSRMYHVIVSNEIKCAKNSYRSQDPAPIAQTDYEIRINYMLPRMVCSVYRCYGLIRYNHDDPEIKQKRIVKISLAREKGHLIMADL